MDETAAAIEVETGEFDLIPDPRILPMLGEINLELWRCIAELADNSVDGFLHALRAGSSVPTPQIDVTLPSADTERATVRVADNGPGMTPDKLQQAVRAGWSGNNPVDSLGLFGMGFNIATARLGTVTDVWTTREGDPVWHGLRIDFDQLRARRTFRTPHLTRPKLDPSRHGTEIVISALKPEQRAWLSKQSNQNTVRRMLAQSYSAMLRQGGVPLTFQLFVNSRVVQARKHCVWSEDRLVQTSDGEISPVISFNHPMPAKPYCTHCMNWLPAETPSDARCPVCETVGTVVARTRSVRGWIGLQRYFDKTEFGFDLIRNGRKIEIANKDLFVWRDDAGLEVPEYPIDDPRGRGRFVGEIHIDHCRVDYAKQRFDRNDPSWSELVRVVRGEGPLRPEKARELGFGPNESPLFRLFKAFRRSDPKSKQAGAWGRILAVRDNDRAATMARQFHEGVPEYQSDTKWWELVQEQDAELLYADRRPSPGAGSPAPAPGEDGPGLPPGLTDPPGASTNSPPNPTSPPTRTSEPARPVRRPIPSLSRRFDHPGSGTTWSVDTFESSPGDPSLATGAPWVLLMADVATRKYHFIYNRDHEVFNSVTFTPTDALMIELARQPYEQLRNTANELPFSSLVADFRRAYSKEDELDPRQMAADAAESLALLADLVAGNCSVSSRPDLFNGLNVEEQQEVMRSLAARKIRPDAAIADGSFLKYSPFHIITSILDRSPELFFDGNIWDVPYEGLDYRDPAVTERARAEIRERYRSLVSDAAWLSRLEAADYARVSRPELIRALMSLRLLRPDRETT